MDLTPYSLFIWLIAITVLILLSLVFDQVEGNKSWHRKSLGPRLRFSSPIGLKVISISLGFFFVLCPLLSMNLPERRVEGWILFIAIELMSSTVGGLLFLSACKRYELFLDVQSRTYQLSQGWWFKPTTRHGSWNDFEGIFMQCKRTQDHDIYTIGIAWKQGTWNDRNATPILGRFWQKNKADMFLQEITKTLGVPRVVPPLTKVSCTV